MVLDAFWWVGGMTYRHFESPGVMFVSPEVENSLGASDAV